jgi:hypothetical protein
MLSIIDKLKRKDNREENHMIFKTTCISCGKDIICCEGSYTNVCDVCKTIGMYR